MIRNLWFGLIYYFLPIGLIAETSKAFNIKDYPVEEIPIEVILSRGLDDRLKSLHDSCNWEARIGKKVDVFWIKSNEGNIFGHSFEYFLDCDNVRLIYWTPNPRDIFPIVDFMIEDLEEDSKYVSSPKKHLKNKKRFQKYLKN